MMQVITNAEDEEQLEALIDLDASGGVSQGDRTFSPYAECEPMSMHLTCMGVRKCTVYVMSQSDVRSVWVDVADYRLPPRTCCRQMEEPRATPRSPRSRSRPRGATAVAAATAPCASASGGAADGAAGDAVDKA